jgi:hypothetical protein
MPKTKQDKLKQQILTLIRKSGPAGTQYIVDHIELPDHIFLNNLLTELVTENRLSRSYTLLVNGDPDCIYNRIS